MTEPRTSAPEREDGNLSYLDLDLAFPLVNYTNKKTESRKYEHNYNEKR